MTKNPNNTEDNTCVVNYQRAEAFEHSLYFSSAILNARIYPNWISDSDTFWYIRKVRKSHGGASHIAKEFRFVDVEKGLNIEAFDHELLAKVLSRASDLPVDSEQLPITSLNFDSPTSVKFRAFENSWDYDPVKGICKKISTSPSNWLMSPDGTKAVFLRNNNLWLRDIESSREHALTTDGERFFCYGSQPERTSLVAGFLNQEARDSVKPEALWSPNSKYLLTKIVDERNVSLLPVTKYVPITDGVRPESTDIKYALPGDKHLVGYRLLAINTATGELCFADQPPIWDTVLFAGLFSGNRSWWGKDSLTAYFVDMSRGQKVARVSSFDVLTGKTKKIFEESSDTYIDLNLDFESAAALMPLPETNELIWFSERSGWAHLYLYDLVSGEMKKQITEGDWLVRELLHFDENRRELLVLAAGRHEDIDPYYCEICKVNIDSGKLSSVAGGDYEYLVCSPNQTRVKSAILLGQTSRGCAGVAKNGNFIVATRTRVDQAAQSYVLDRDGRIRLALEASDQNGLPAGWHWPEPIKLVSADMKTDIYGIIFRPSDFSPKKKYPIIDWAHTNPFYSFVPKALDCFPYMSMQALAELGFIVVVIDGRGSCKRSKSFHDASYGEVHKGSDLDDHVAGIRQIAERYPYMDLSKVGIVDMAGSNGPLYGLLAFPDFYKVGAVYSSWDVRTVSQGEVYQGLINENDYESSVLGNLAANLEGKLLIMHGMLDPFFHVSGVFQMIDALVKENKDFDLVLLPNGGHAWDSSHYGLRRIWDYFVTHLKGDKPPQYKLMSGLEVALDQLNAD